MKSANNKNDSPQSVRSLDRAAYQEYFAQQQTTAGKPPRFEGVHRHIESPPLTSPAERVTRGVDRNVSLPSEQHHSSDDADSSVGSSSTCEFLSTESSVSATSLYRRGSSSFASLEPADSVSSLQKNRRRDSEHERIAAEESLWANDTNIYERVQLLLDDNYSRAQPQRTLPKVEPAPSTRSTRGGSADTMIDPGVDPAPPTEPSPQSIMVEIAPGVNVPLRGAAETERAIANSFYVQCECFACQKSPLYCILDAEYFLCPNCRSISPSPLQSSSGNGGLGMGFELS